MAGLLLDTTVLIDALRGRPALDRLRGLRTSGPPPFVCAVNVEEVWRGVRPAEEDSVRRLLAGLRLAPLGRREGELAGTWRRQAAQRGETLAQADCLVAASALGVGALVATGNPKDFAMPGVVVEHWPTGR